MALQSERNAKGKTCVAFFYVCVICHGKISICFEVAVTRW